MGAIKLPHSGGNSVSIAAPEANPGSDRTLYVPGNANGTILTNTTPGCILQVLSTTKIDTFSTSSTSYIDISGVDQAGAGSIWCVKITPSSSSNKILVMMSANLGHDNYVSAFVQLVRDSTAIAIGEAHGSRRQATGSNSDDPSDDIISCVSVSHLDSPSTTSEITYKVQIGGEASGNTGNVHLNRGGEYSDNNQNAKVVSSITVMEVAA